MTKHEELKALDLKIAELKGIVCCEGWVPANMSRMEPTFYKQCEHKEGECVPKTFYPPKYSEKIQEAWKLFEEMGNYEKGYVYIEHLTEGNFECVYNDLTNDKKIDEYAGTAPEAICRAWIKWKESKSKLNK